MYQDTERMTQPTDHSLVLSVWQKLMPKRHAPIDYAKTILNNAHFTDPFEYISRAVNYSITFPTENASPPTHTKLIPLSQMEKRDYAMLVDTIASSDEILRELEK